MLFFVIINQISQQQILISNNSIKHSGRFLPIIPVELKGGEEWQEFDAYVDSGAGYSVFQAWVIEVLDIKLEDGEEDHVIVGDGNKLAVFIHKIKIRLADVEFEATIGFSKGLGIGFNVLGQKDIFDKFRICFDKSEKVVEFNKKC